MKKSFIIDLDVGSDTDFLSIAEDLHSSLSTFDYPVLKVLPFASKSDAPTLLGILPQSPGGVLPPNVNQ